VRWLLAILLAAGPALAQPAAPQAAANEDPGDVVARVRFERAVRAEFDGKREEAIREAQAVIEAKPDGRFAAAARELIGRLHGDVPQTVRSTGVGPRAELVITSTLAGIYLSSLLAGATASGEKGTVAWLMAGTGGALAGSILATSGARVPQSMPQMVQNGLGYGTAASLLGSAIGDANGNIAGIVAAGAGAGVVAGLVASPHLTGGDSGAMTTTLLYGGLIPAAIAYLGDGNDRAVEWAALLGSTAGIFVGPVLNARLHWSRGRWNLVSLGGAVGGLLGGGTAVLTDSRNRGAAALVTGGAVAGLVLTALLTSDFGSDEPRPGAASLLHLEEGKLSAGDLPSAITATEKGAFLRLLDGRF
jgi:hypothetical protein